MERKRDNRGRFRLGVEIESSTDVNGSGFEIEECQSERVHHNFVVPAIGELLVKYKRPKYDFEKWDWMLFQWPHDRDDANFEMGISDLESTFDSDKRRYDDFIERNQSLVEKQKDSKSIPVEENQESDDISTNSPEIIKNCARNWLDEYRYFSPESLL